MEAPDDGLEHVTDRIIHFTTSAKPGPPPETPTAPPKRSAPRWLHTVWLVGLLVTLLLLFLPGSSKAPLSLHYSVWKTKLDAGQVKTATIDQSGGVSGQLTNNKKYTTRVPTAIKDDDLAADLARHKVDVKATETGTSVWSIIGGLLPFVLLLGVYLLISRRATRQIAGGVMGSVRQRPRSMTRTDRTRASPTSPDTKAQSAKSVRWSIS